MSYLAKTPEDLLPCPFCGGEARIIAKPYEPKVCVGCDDDTCLGFSGLGWLYDSEKEATDAWNRRAERTCHVEVSHGSHGPEPRFPGDAWTMHHVCSACGGAIDRDDPYCKHRGARGVSK